MAKIKQSKTEKSNDEIRSLILRFFYDRNQNATSSKGKRGSAVKISDVKSQLKSLHDLTQQQVQANLTYLISQGWIQEISETKQVTARGGTVIPSKTIYYQITAAGIDKIEGPGEFTMHKFHGIKIEATGQNIITLGDGNQVNAKFGEIGRGLAQLRDAVVASSQSEEKKMAIVADIETIQSQLAKPQPNPSILKAAWETIKVAAAIDGCTELVHTVGSMILPLLH
jgi:competence protein ComGC